MEKLLKTRSLQRSIFRRSKPISTPVAAGATSVNHQSFTADRYFHPSPPSFPSSSSYLSSSSGTFILTTKKVARSFRDGGSILHEMVPDKRSPFSMGIGSTRSFSEDVTHLPVIKDPEIESAFKGLMAASWDEPPASVMHDAKKALSKRTDDKASQEALANVFRAAEAVEEFSGFLVSLRMELDDSVGISGENVKPLSDDFINAISLAFQRYNAYLDSFGPDEVYLRKKVENELGIRMIHLKMRCSGLGSEWGKVTVLGTSGLAGSYVEHRA